MKVNTIFMPICAVLVFACGAFAGERILKGRTDGWDTTYVWLEDQCGRLLTEPNQTVLVWTDPWEQEGQIWESTSLADCYVSVGSWDTYCHGISQDVLDWIPDANGLMVNGTGPNGFMRIKGYWDPDHNNYGVPNDHTHPCIYDCSTCGGTHCAPGCAPGFYDPNDWTVYDPNRVYYEESWWQFATPHVSWKYVKLPGQHDNQAFSVWYFRNDRNCIPYEEHWWEYMECWSAYDCTFNQTGNELPCGWYIDECGIHWSFDVWMENCGQELFDRWLTEPQPTDLSDFAELL